MYSEEFKHEILERVVKNFRQVCEKKRKSTMQTIIDHGRHS